MFFWGWKCEGWKHKENKNKIKKSVESWKQTFSFEAIVTDFVFYAGILVLNKEIQKFCKQSKIIHAGGVFEFEKWKDKDITLSNGAISFGIFSL